MTRTATTSRSTLLAIAALALACLGALPAAAQAGTYTVRTCGATGAGGSSAGWTPAYAGGANSTTMALITGCTGAQFYGLIAASSANNHTVSGGAQADYGFNAPPGDTITHISWSGAADTAPNAGTGTWRTGLWWQGGSSMCTSAAKACHLAGNGAGQATNTPWVQVVANCASTTCHTRSTAGVSNHAARAQLTSASFTISDPAAPALNVSGAFWTGNWQGGIRSLSYAASDASGIALVALNIDGGLSSYYTAPTCSYNKPAPCPTGVAGTWSVNTSQLAGGVDGPHTAYLIAYDASGNPRSTAPITIHIDNHAATRPEGLTITSPGGSAWTRTNAFSAQWTNPPEAQAPVVSATWCVTKASAPTPGTTNDSECVRAGDGGPNTLSGLHVPNDGRWTLYVSTVDAAGNTSNPSDPGLLRYDATPPSPTAFAAQDPADPTALDVEVGDDASGVASGQIELARQGTHTWHQLPTAVDGDLLRARVDDSALPRGTYALRATAIDAAGNVSISSRRTSGQAASIAIPIRISTKATLGFVRVRHIRRHGHRVRVTTLSRTRTVRYQHPVRIDGRLTTADGQALASRRLTISATPDTNTGRPRIVGYVTTDKNGNYSYRGIAHVSRTLQFAFPGSAALLPASRSVKLRVPARSTIHVSPRRLLNGSFTTFSGRVLGGHIPPGGAQIVLRFFAQHSWKHIAGQRVYRTDRQGHWSIQYPFNAVNRTTRFVWRLQVLHAANYPYADGYSRTVSIIVQGH